MESKLITEKGTCYICGCNRGYERHHCLHGTANRRMAEREGLWVWLCDRCHRAIHDYGEFCHELEMTAQASWENAYMKSYPYENHADLAAREAFRKIFGKSYL